MAEFTNQSLIFHSDALSENQLVITHLHGREALSQTFRFELDLLGSKQEAGSLKLEDLLYKSAKVGIRQPRSFGGTIKKVTLWYEGVLSEVEQLDERQGWVRYRAVLVPKLWLLNKFFRSRIFQNVTVDQMVTEVLTGKALDSNDEVPDSELKLVGKPFAPLPPNEPAKSQEENRRRDDDFQFNLGRIDPSVDPQARKACPQREYVVQYEESDYALMSRWLEHEGIFFFFQNDTADHENVVFADHIGAYKPVAANARYPYRPQSASGATATEAGEEEISSFHVRVERQPRQVQLNDYNWRSPKEPLLVKKPVRDNAAGVQNDYNDHYKTVGQGDALAQVRAEEFLCRETVVRGKSTCRAFRPGRTFELEGHFVGGLDAAYLLTAVEHHAEQAINLDASTVTGAKYENTFEAIPADVVFRPACETEWPTIKGVMHATVDGEKDAGEDESDYAQLDELGRYKLTIPFDDKLGDATPGSASRWVRLAQPYAGVDGGMHFPLLKGTEVIVTHIDGDPDRPIIASAVPNVESHSPVHKGNASQNRIQTTSGNLFMMDDSEHATGFVKIDGGGRQVEDLRMPRRAGAGSVGAGPGYGGAAAGRPRASSAPPRAAPPAGAPTPPPGPPPAPRGPLNLHGLRPAGGALPESLLRPSHEQVRPGRGMAGLRGSDEFGAQVGLGEEGEGPGKNNSAQAIKDLDFAGATDLVKLDNDTALKWDATNGFWEDADGDGVFDAGEEVGKTPLEWFVESNDADHSLKDTTETALDWLAKYGRYDGHGGHGTTLAADEKYILTANEWDDAIKINYNVGDQITIKQGGNTDRGEFNKKGVHWTFDNVGHTISFGTGGYGYSQDGTPDALADNVSVSKHWGSDTSYSETHGDVHSESHFYGRTTGTSFNWGTVTSTSYAFDALATFSFLGAAETATEIKIGAFNSNSVLLGGKLSTDICIGYAASLDCWMIGKGSIDIALGFHNSIEIEAGGKNTMKFGPSLTETNANRKSEFSLDKAKVILQQNSATLKESEAILKYDVAALQADHALLAEHKAALKANEEALDETKAVLNANANLLKSSMNALVKDESCLSMKQVGAIQDLTYGLTNLK